MPITEHDLVAVLLSERNRLVVYVWSIVRNYHVAEDIFQEVSLLAVEQRFS